MTLLLFVILLVLICAIARYNEDNKLFWYLLVSLLAGIAGGAMYQKLTTSDTKSKYEQVSPMPVESYALSTIEFDKFVQHDTCAEMPTLAGEGSPSRDSVLKEALSEGVEENHSRPPQYLDDG